MCDVLDKVENRGIEKGIVKGESRGENKMALLVKKLLDQNRICLLYTSLCERFCILKFVLKAAGVTCAGMRAGTRIDAELKSL